MNRTERVATLTRLLRERIVHLDGAMATMIQAMRPDEEDFRGKRLDEALRSLTSHPDLGPSAGPGPVTTAVEAIKAAEKPLKGDNDLLSVTRPDMIYEIHQQMLAAGADPDLVISPALGDESERRVIHYCHGRQAERLQEILVEAGAKPA